MYCGLRSYVLHYGEGLLFVGVCAYQLYGVALFVAGEALFAYLPVVAADNRIGRSYYGTGGAVVLFQLEKGGAFVVFGEAEYVLYFGSAERIYALGVVAHHAYVSASGRKLLYYKILREVGVLILVH